MHYLFALCFILYTQMSFAVSLPPAESQHGMVVSSQKLANKVGIDILKAGGNAIDAAVAMGYALAVVHPCCGNIGGGGFMIIHTADGKQHFINFRETAPSAVTAQSLVEGLGDTCPVLYGSCHFLAVGVPGTVLGLNTVLEKYGTMPLGRVMAPAIRLANVGYPLTKADYKFYDNIIPVLKTKKNTKKIFFDKQGEFLPKHYLKQKQLGKTLSIIAKEGSKGFYEGEVAKKMTAAIQADGGVMTELDLKNYQITTPDLITCHYRDYDIVSAPPPSSGGVTICQILGMLEAYPLKEWGFHSAKTIHHMVEAMRLAFADRANSLGDPAFVKNPIEKLLSKEHIDALRKKIQPNKKTDSSKIAVELSAAKEQHETTHYSVADNQGNAVAVTYTLNGFMGTRLMPADLGFFLNNELNDFAVTVGKGNIFQLIESSKNAPAPNKTPLSSMAPTMVYKDGKLVMVIGSPGGPTIISSIAQVLINVVDYEMNIQQAVNEPRFHMQWMPDIIFYEQGALNPDTKAILLKQGHQFKEDSVYHNKTIAAVSVIQRDSKTQHWKGAMDVRRPTGGALGY